MKIPITFPDPDPEPEVVDIVKERTVEVIGWLRVVFHCLNAYQLHQISRRDLDNRAVKRLRMSFLCMALALGFDDVACVSVDDGEDEAEAAASGAAKIAKKLGMNSDSGKQAATKCVLHFIEQLKLSPLTSQRKEEARKNMSAARKRQVKRENILETL